MIIPMAAWMAAALVAGAPAAISPEQAAGKALMSCVAHSAGISPISADNAQHLATTGLAFQARPPAFLNGMAVTPYGIGSFAQSPSSEGQVWAVGYDKGTCMVMALGASPEPIEQRLTAMFSIPGTWKPEPIKQTDGARWTQYGWIANGRRLTAQMKVQPLPASPVKGLVMVTIAPEANGK